MWGGDSWVGVGVQGGETGVGLQLVNGSLAGNAPGNGKFNFVGGSSSCDILHGGKTGGGCLSGEGKGVSDVMERSLLEWKGYLVVLKAKDGIKKGDERSPRFCVKPIERPICSWFISPMYT